MTTLRERRRERWRAARPAIAWTLGSFVVALVIAVASTTGLAEAQRACVGGGECPDASDPRIAWLLFAFVGVPLLWLLGLLLLAVRSPTRSRG